MLRAKFRVDFVERKEYPSGDDVKVTENVTLQAVASGGPDDPNKSWSEATPWGQLKMAISNPSAQGKLQQGKEYFIDISEA